MPRVLRFVVLIALLAIIVSVPAFGAKGAIYMHGGINRVSDEEFQRILDADSIKYVCVQEIYKKGWTSFKAKRRAEKLTNAGKRVVMQIWWGPGGELPWSKYGFPNIALDPAVRSDFFKEVVDPCIAVYGAENIYGVNLLEETGMQLATDVGPRENPDDFWTFEDHTEAYTCPFYSGWGNPAVGGVHIANVRRHEKDFTAMTGLRFADEPKWGPLERYLFDRWISNRLQSAAQIEFAKHIHRKYPGMKAFTWDIINSAEQNPRTDHHLEAQYFDGVITDNYDWINFNFLYQSAYRTLHPKGELIALVMGGMGDALYPYADHKQKLARIMGPYLAGADGMGFFELPMDYAKPDRWKTNTDILGSLDTVPAFRKKSPILLISDFTYYARQYWLGLKYFDFLPTWEAHSVDFSPYQVVILQSSGGDALTFWDSPGFKRKYGLPGYVDSEALNRFVARGGVLVISGQTVIPKDSPFFLAREGYLYTGEPEPAPKSLTISPDSWLRDKAGLRRGYNISVTPIPVFHDSRKVVETSAGYFCRHGKGAVFFLPFLRTYDGAEADNSAQWQDYRHLLADVTSGVLRIMGKRKIADQYFIATDSDQYHFEVTSDDGRTTGALLFDGYAPMSGTAGVIKGRDVFSGKSNQVLSPDNPAILVHK